MKETLGLLVALGLIVLANVLNSAGFGILAMLIVVVVLFHNIAGPARTGAHGFEQQSAFHRRTPSSTPDAPKPYGYWEHRRDGR